MSPLVNLKSQKLRNHLTFFSPILSLVSPPLLLAIAIKPVHLEREVVPMFISIIETREKCHLKHLQTLVCSHFTMCDNKEGEAALVRNWLDSAMITLSHDRTDSSPLFPASNVLIFIA